MKNANEIKPFCYYVTNAEGDVEYNGIPQMSDGRIGAPLYTEPPASSQLLAAVKELIAATGERYMGAPDHVDPGVKRDGLSRRLDALSRRLDAWVGLLAAVNAEEVRAPHPRLAEVLLLRNTIETLREENEGLQARAKKLAAKLLDNHWPHGATVKLRWTGAGYQDKHGWAKRDEQGRLVTVFSGLLLDDDSWEVVAERREGENHG